MSLLETIVQFVTLVAAFVGGFLALAAFYRLTLHPLAQYPGPLLCKLSSIPDVYHAWKGDRHLHYYRLHRKYGSVVRYAPNKVSFDTGAALKHIYSGNKKEFIKSDFYEGFPAVKGFPSVHSAIIKSEHAKKKRVMSHAFSEQALASAQPYIMDKIVQLCDLLGDNTRDTVVTPSGKPAKMISRLTSYFSFDVMGELCFGKGFDMLTSADNRFALRMTSNAAHRHLVYGCFRLLDKLPFIGSYFFGHIVEDRKKFVGYSRAVASKRMALGDEGHRKDLFHYLMHATDPETGKGFERNELLSESNLLIVAGSDTTATSLAGCLHYLGLHPDVRKELTRQVRAQFYSVDEIHSGSTLTKGIPLLRACIDESMRLSPPVPGVLPRTALEDVVIDGCKIPKGCDVGVSTWSMHRNPKHFVKPLEYDPYRWLRGGQVDDSSKYSDVAQDIDEKAALNETANARAGYAPFSIGTRSCIGRALAYSELDCAVARICFMYDFEVCLEGKLGSGVFGYGYDDSDEFVAGRGKGGKINEWDVKKRDGEEIGTFRLWDHFAGEKEGSMMVFAHAKKE